MVYSGAVGLSSPANISLTMLSIMFSLMFSTSVLNSGKLKF